MDGDGDKNDPLIIFERGKRGIMNLLDLIRADGHELKKAATSNGGEWCGGCPWCGGNDRFRVWPSTNRFWCRQCEKAGDSIQYLRDKRGFSFKEACEHLGRTPGARSSGPRPAPAWTPQVKETPSEAWQRQAKHFLDMAGETLWTPRGEAMRRWLHGEKGLQDATIKRASFVLNLGDKYEQRAAWGLDVAFQNSGTERKQWIPAGLVIPFFVGGAVHRLRVRRTEPGNGPRYITVAGSCMAPMSWGHDKAGVAVVESELDGLLLNQEASDLCAVVALGNDTAKPDTATHALLNETPVILNCLDSDEAGAKAAWRFWPETYGPKVKRWPCIKGKDPSDAQKNGLNIREWIIAGLFENEGRFERFCIQTIDGKLSDIEALNQLT
jgi:hypothetical protein